MNDLDFQIERDEWESDMCFGPTREDLADIYRELDVILKVLKRRLEVRL